MTPRSSRRSTRSVIRVLSLYYCPPDPAATYSRASGFVLCHGWAGDGAGAGQSPGGAANLRVSKLDRQSLIMVISCGIPGRAMPHFDDQAYTDKRCYGTTADELGDRVPPFPPSTVLPPRDIGLVADYLIAKVIGRGPITREECVEALGPRVRSCSEYPAAAP